MFTVEASCVLEWSAASDNAAQRTARVTNPQGETRVLPSFLGADGRRHFRYSSPLLGQHHIECGAERATLEVVPYCGENPLYRHGAPVRRNNQYLEHTDGTPFFYLADTWWMGLTTRLPYPQGIAQLASDRREKGFTAVQIVAGLYPDMPWQDVRGANEAGFPWNADFTEINPAYFDATDKKIRLIIENGMVPVIVGCWGFFATLAGVEVIRRHWDELIARWAAYPVIWCAAGEANMAWYGADRESGVWKHPEYLERSRSDWDVLVRHIKESDPFRRAVTIHPTSYGHLELNDEDLLDLDMLQTGHSAHRSLVHSMQAVKSTVARGKMPVINSEVCYEGICGSSHADIQRYLFLSNVLSGACGHSYGANGIWQLNGETEPYGVSPHGATWGNTSWAEAAALPGSRHIGNAKRFLCRFDWWRFESHPEWVENPCSYEDTDGLFVSGIAGEVRFIFNPSFGGCQWDTLCVRKLEPGIAYHAYYYDMVADKLSPLGMARGDEKGEWRAPRVTILQDWILLLTTKELEV